MHFILVSLKTITLREKNIRSKIINIFWLKNSNKTFANTLRDTIVISVRSNCDKRSRGISNLLLSHVGENGKSNEAAWWAQFICANTALCISNRFNCFRCIFLLSFFFFFLFVSTAFYVSKKHSLPLLTIVSSDSDDAEALDHVYIR